MFYRLYEILHVEVEQHDNGQEIIDVDMLRGNTIPEDKIDDEQYIDNLVSEATDHGIYSINPKGAENHHFLIVKLDKDYNYLDCVHVFFPYTHFLDCVDSNHRAICEFYFRKNKLL